MADSPSAQLEGCVPNVVTYNTLVDVFGKLGRWQDAIQVLEMISAQVQRIPGELGYQASSCSQTVRLSMLIGAGARDAYI